MLMLFPTLKPEGLSDIEIFRDHKKEDLFYVLRSTPVIARDKDGTPALSYTLFARNADIAYASSANKDLVETQLGQLLFTTDLSLSDSEHKIVMDYLRKVVNEPKHTFTRLYRKLLKLPLNNRQPIEPKIAYPDTWKEGTARLEILEGLGDTFVKSSSDVVKTSLIGSNSASFYTTFGIEGAQIFFDALSQGYTEGEGDEGKTPLQAIVHYDLKGFAFVPNLEVKVTGHASQIYDFVQEQTNKYKKEIEQGTRTTTKKFLGITYSKETRKFDNKVDIEKTDIHKMVEKMIDNKIINIEITDYGDVGTSSEERRELEDGIRSTLMETIMGTIVTSFFQTAFVADAPAAAPDGAAPAGGQGGTAQPNPAMGVAPRDSLVKNHERYYHFRNDVDKSRITSINFSFKKNGTVEFVRSPNSTLIAQLTESERKSLVQKVVDISSPLVQAMETQIKVNADFAEDKIHSVIVNVSYKQKDHRSGIVRQNSKSFLYSTGEEVNTFRVTMARNEKGELLDFYDVEAKISYKGTAEAPPPIKLTNVSDRQMVISYDKLGFITTNVMVGDMDWEVVKEAVVSLEYVAEPNKPDTKKQIRLSKDQPNGTWKCYMYGHLAKKYRYKVKYFYLDGTESESESKEDSRETLIIDDALQGRLKASFDVILDANTVTNAKVEILYQDEAQGVSEEYSKWFQATETWDFSMRLRENAARRFKYRYFVQYADGLVNTSDWQEAGSDEDIPPINLKRYERSLLLDAGMLDWNKWKVVYATISYSDPENNYDKSETLRLDPAVMMQTFKVLAFSPAANTFSYSLKFASNQGVVDVPATTLSSNVLILHDPQAVEV